MKGSFKIFLLWVALTAPGCFFGSDPVFLPDSDTTQDETQDGEDAPQDEPEGIADEDGVLPDVPTEPDIIDVPVEDVAPPDFIPDFPMDDLPVDLSDISPGACTNAADQAILADVDVVLEAETCVMTCSMDMECMAGCLSDNTGLSSACSQCYAEATGCILTYCLSGCMSDPHSDVCIACMVENGCYGPFVLCSGMTDF